MTVSQIEHAPTFSDPLPAGDTFDRLEDLFIERRGLIGAIKVKKFLLAAYADGVACAAERPTHLRNQITQAELRRAEVEFEIVEVARLIVAEHSNAELIVREVA